MMRNGTSTPKLTYTFADGNGSASIEWASQDFVERRHTYRWTLDTGRGTFTDEDLRSGSGQPVDMPKMLACLFGFIAAFGEARDSGTEASDNWDLFPDAMGQWAVSMQDELSMAASELAPEENA
jgi:hypothetical protein